MGGMALFEGKDEEKLRAILSRIIYQDREAEQREQREQREQATKW